MAVVGGPLLLCFRFFFIVGRGPAYFWTSALRPCNGPVHMSSERRGIGRCVLYVRDVWGRQG